MSVRRLVFVVLFGVFLGGCGASIDPVFYSRGQRYGTIYEYGSEGSYSYRYRNPRDGYYHGYGVLRYPHHHRNPTVAGPNTRRDMRNIIPPNPGSVHQGGGGYNGGGRSSGWFEDRYPRR